MSSVVISGDTSGAITLQAPAVSGNTTLNLPASSGTVLTQNSSAPANSFVVDASGNVGIGTSSPTKRLSVAESNTTGMSIEAINLSTASNTTKYASVLFSGYDTVGTYKQTGLIASNPDDVNYVNSNFTISTRIANTLAERMRIDSSGNVGIGTSSPSANLEVSGAGNREIRITSTSTGEPILGMWVPGTTFTFFKIERSTGNLVISDGTERVRLNGANFMFNSGYGSVATAYGCRAWVNFNGTGTVAIRASGNVSSITDNGVGDYTVNFTNAMPDANYATNVNAVRNSVADTNMDAAFNKNDTYSSSAVRFRTVIASVDTRTAEDAFQAFVSVFR